MRMSAPSLPDDWVLLPLEKVGTWRGGGTPSKSRPDYWRGGTIPWVSPKDMKVDVVAKTQDYITQRAIRESATSVVPPGSVLLVVRSGILRHSLPIALTGRDVAINQDMKAVTPASNIEARYLALALRALERDILQHCRKAGTTVQSIDFKALLQFEIPIAPSAVQRRIVEEIEKHLTRLDAGVAALERVRANLKRYRAAVLKAACEGRLVPTEAELARREGRAYEPASVLLERIKAEKAKHPQPKRRGRRKPAAEPVLPDDLPKLPEGWVWTSLGTVAHVLGGITKHARRKSLPLQVPYLRVANVYAGEFRLQDVATIGVTNDELDRSLLKKGDLLIVEGNGSRDQIGRVALWEGSINPCVHQNHLIRVRPTSPALSRWLLLWLMSPYGRSLIEKVASSSSGLYTLNITKVSSLPIALAPLAEQYRILAAAGGVSSVTDELDNTAAKSLTLTVRLRRAILSAAFSGQLAGRSQEPAIGEFSRVAEQPSPYSIPPTENT